ncbi:hypothetical protein GFY24_25820 [Nocardia sp. SYP-A9097]|uniref:hypothetical protein n=1 Tax=Nocardia sp. SYP-A9097 TaxID=2663237 RepID=UPI00129A8EAF|nr:hypothetical protein [Nocardia sp. SYP-A9097]MRH90815.1 hypothetical protein [Nocardia sp. SYP-A9097]
MRKNISRRAFTLGALGAGAAYSVARTAPVGSAKPDSIFRLTADAATHTVDRDFFGVNGARIISAQNARQWHDPAFRDALAAARPGLLRVQGGTTSQWIDWRTGLFQEGDGGEFAARNDGRPPLLLSDWAELVRHTGATPVFDLNVAHSTIDDQLDMLREARRLGMPVRYVELGNELWISMRPYTELYPTGADYARVMNEWIAVIRREFPQARIGVAGVDDSGMFALMGERATSWNGLLFSTIRDADAVTLHPYWIVDPVAADIGSTAGGGAVAWARLAEHVLPQVPAGMEVWYTEYNQMGREAAPPLSLLPAPQQTWAVGLSVAAFTLRTLQDPRTGMAVMHCALNGAPAVDTGGGGTTNQALHALISDGSGGSELFGRTALHRALSPIYASMADGTEVRALRLDAAVQTPAALITPAYVGPAELFTGVELAAGGRTTAVLVNASDRALRITLPPSLIGARDATVYAAAPTSAPAFVPGDTVSETRTAISGSIELPPYSEAIVNA